MTIIDDECSCGAEITVLTKPDSKSDFRKDGKQAVSKQDYDKGNLSYNMFRCKECLEPIAVTVKSFNYE